LTDPEGPREAQDGATGEGRGGEGNSQALPLAFLLAFSLTLVAFMPVIWPSPLQRLLGHPLAQYVIWLRCRDLKLGLDVFGSLIPAATAALLAVVLRARGLGALLPFAARGISVARLLAYAALPPGHRRPAPAGLAVSSPPGSQGLSNNSGRPGPLPRLRGTSSGRDAGHEAEGPAPSLAGGEGRALAGRGGLRHGPGPLAPR